MWGSQSRQILVAEDDPCIRSILAQLLELEGYSVLEASNGREALDILNQNEALPSAMVLDFMMPVMSGDEVIREIDQSKKLRGIPIILISASDSAPRMSGPGRHFLRKPLEADRLLDVVKTATRAAVSTHPLSD